MFLKTVSVLCVFVSSLVSADVQPEQKKEVDHLLEFVKKSDCIIDRNGTQHTGVKGVKHIQRKYDHFKDDIKTTEEFVELSATKSTMSGSYYTAKCPGKEPIRTQDWLLGELENFRAEEKKKKTPMNANKRTKM